MKKINTSKLILGLSICAGTGAIIASTTPIWTNSKNSNNIQVTPPNSSLFTITKSQAQQINNILNNKIQNTQSLNLLNSALNIEQTINEISSAISIPKEYINDVEFVQNESNNINAEIYFNIEIQVENNNNLVSINNMQLNSNPIIAPNITTNNVIVLNDSLIKQTNQIFTDNVALFPKNANISELNNFNNINPLKEQIAKVIGVSFESIENITFIPTSNVPSSYTSDSNLSNVNVQITFNSNNKINLISNNLFSANANVLTSTIPYNLGNFYNIVINNENAGQLEAAIKSTISSSEQITQNELNITARQQQALTNIQQQTNIDASLIKSINFIPLTQQKLFNIEIQFNDNVNLSSIDQKLFNVDSKTNLVTNVLPMNYSPIITINQELGQNLSNLITNYVDKMSFFDELNKNEYVEQLINALNEQLSQSLPPEDLITNIQFINTAKTPNSIIEVNVTFNNEVDFESLSNTPFTITNGIDGPTIKLTNNIIKRLYIEVAQNTLFINRFNFTKKLYEMCNGNIQNLVTQLDTIDEIKTLFNDQTFIDSSYDVSKINNLSKFEYNQEGQFIEFFIVFNDLNVFSKLRIHENYIKTNPDNIKALYTYQSGTSLEEGNAIITGCTQPVDSYVNLIFPEGAVTSKTHFIWGNYENSKLNSVLLPSTYNEVSVHSFSWNYNLTSLTITSPTIVLNHWSFGDAKNLRNVTIWCSQVAMSGGYELDVGNNCEINLQYSNMNQQNYNNFVSYIKNSNYNDSITFIPPVGITNPSTYNSYSLLNINLIDNSKKDE